MKSDYIIGNRNLLFDWINWLSGWVADWLTGWQLLYSMNYSQTVISDHAQKTVLFWCDSFRLLFALMRMKSEFTANVVMILNWAKKDEHVSLQSTGESTLSEGLSPLIKAFWWWGLMKSEMMSYFSRFENCGLFLS